MRHLIHKINVMMGGLLIVLKHMFQRPITRCYPEERPVLPQRSRGRHYLTRWNDGKERCVGCELCAIVCPSQAIYVRAANNPTQQSVSHGERFAEDFQINMLRCIFCGYCEEACPTGAIVLSSEYELVSTSKEDLIYTKPRLLETNPGDSGRDPQRKI